jgi:hypothetical protein
VEGVRAGSPEYEITREVFVVWIPLQEFKSFDGFEDGLPRNEPTREADVDVQSTRSPRMRS